MRAIAKLINDKLHAVVYEESYPKRIVIKDVSLDSNIELWQPLDYTDLGEISSKAIWVKEGDEIEISKSYFNTEEGDLALFDIKPINNDWVIDGEGIWKVKCPCCGTYK